MKRMTEQELRELLPVIEKLEMERLFGETPPAPEEQPIDKGESVVVTTKEEKPVIQVDILKRFREHVLPKIPKETMPQVEIEMKRIEDEVRLVDDVMNCTACPLAENCTNKVPGKGNMNADIVFVGEIPGEQEDMQGEPFVGPGGAILEKAIEAVGWTRDELYITNLMKCRTPKNRQPLQSEIMACHPHLQQEFSIIQPKVVVCLGGVASSTLIHPDFKMKQEHGHWFERDGIRYISAYHPSYLLRLGEGSAAQNAAKWDVFNTLQKVKAYQESGFESDRF
jgi:uracil-DNA glycosylase